MVHFLSEWWLYHFTLDKIIFSTKSVVIYHLMTVIDDCFWSRIRIDDSFSGRRYYFEPRPGSSTWSARKTSVKLILTVGIFVRSKQDFSARISVITQRISKSCCWAECGASSTRKDKIKSPRLTQKTRLLQISLIFAPLWPLSFVARVN